MSADNYYMIKKHPHGGYAAVMGFASDDMPPSVDKRHASFLTPQDAFEYASSEYTEYGVRIDPAIIQDAFWGDGATASASKEVIQ